MSAVGSVKVGVQRTTSTKVVEAVHENNTYDVVMAAKDRGECPCGIQTYEVTTKRGVLGKVTTIRTPCTTRDDEGRYLVLNGRCLECNPRHDGGGGGGAAAAPIVEDTLQRNLKYDSGDVAKLLQEYKEAEDRLLEAQLEAQQEAVEVKDKQLEAKDKQLEAKDKLLVAKSETIFSSSVPAPILLSAFSQDSAT
jgi:hypothetical protein